MDMISVIVPIYNSEKYLEECIKSILNQSYRDFELLLIDDGSKDSSGEICKRYELKDTRVKYVHKTNGGVSSARNEGIKLATGKYIAFVDSDDIVKDNMLEVLFSKHADFAMCGYELYDDINKQILNQFVCTKLDGDVRELANNVSDYLLPPYLLGPCFKLFDKEIIKKYDIQFPPELSYGEDAIFVFKYLLHCKTVGISSYIGYVYRKYGNETLSGKFLLDKIDINYQINTMIDKFLKQEEVDERENVISNRLLDCLVEYEKELICTKFSARKKYQIFYQKYRCYKNELGTPNRFAQKIVVFAGKYKIFYPLVYLFKMRG